MALDTMTENLDYAMADSQVIRNASQHARKCGGYNAVSRRSAPSSAGVDEAP